MTRVVTNGFDLFQPGACGGAVSLRIDLGDQPLPDVGEEVEAWSCGAYDILGKFDCCVLRQPAKIRNCSSFLAYQLKKPDRCDVAYCVERKTLTLLHKKRFPRTHTRSEHVAFVGMSECTVKVTNRRSSDFSVTVMYFHNSAFHV